MLVESVGTSLIIGKLRGGSFTNMKEAELKKWYFFVAAFGIEFFTVFMAARNVEFFRDNILFIHGLSYVLLFTGIYFNKSLTAFKIIFIGTFLNFLVIMANGGQMPVSGEAMLRIGLAANLQAIQNGEIITHTVINDKTVLSFLGDVLVLGKPYPRPKIFSIGDIFMAVGIFIYIQSIMIKRIRNDKTVQYMN